MTSSQITGGSVRYTVPSNFQSGKEGCEVTIHWTVADGADAAIEAAIGDRARQEAHRLASGGQSALPVGPTRQSAPAASPAPIVAPTPPAPVAAAAPTVIGGAIPPTNPVSVEAASASSPLGLIATVSTPAAAKPEVVIGRSHPVAPDNGGVIGFVPSIIGAEKPNGHDAEEITDSQLREAVQSKLAKLDPGGDDEIARQRGNVVVGELLMQYVPPRHKVYSLAQSQRAEFLAKLEALA